MPFSVDGDLLNPSFGPGIVYLEVQSGTIVVRARMSDAPDFNCGEGLLLVFRRRRLRGGVHHARTAFRGWGRIGPDSTGHKNGVSYSNQVGNAVFQGIGEG